MNCEAAGSPLRRASLLIAIVVSSGLLALGTGAGSFAANAAIAAEPSGWGTRAPSQLSRPHVSIENFRFAGVSRGESPQASLSLGDALLLAAVRHTASLDEVLDMGVPFQTAQIQRLVEWGVLEQVGIEFRAIIPIPLDDEAAVFRSLLDPLVPQITRALSNELDALYTALAASGQEQIFPALLAWITREQAWHYLSAAPTVDLAALVDRQRQEDPDRGWWGVLWYSESTPQTPGRFDFARSQGRSLLLDWGSDAAMSDAPGDVVDGGANGFLGALDDDAERVRPSEAFPRMLAAELIDRRGHLQFPVLSWDPDDLGSTAAAVDAIARGVAREILARLPVEDLRDVLGTPDLTMIAVLSYAEIAQDLHSAFNATDRGEMIDSSSRLQGPSAMLWLGMSPSDSSFPLPW